MTIDQHGVDPVADGTAALVAPRRRSTFGSLLRNPLAAISLVFLLAVVIIGLASTWIAPFAPNATDLASTNAAPFTEGHLFGADASGRDILSRLMWGTQQTIIACVLVLGVSLLLGLTFGLIAGYYRGKAEAIINFVSDVVQSLPGIVMLIALYALTGPNIPAAMTVFGVIVAPSFYRLVRSVVVSVRSELYIDAAKVVGLSDFRIVGRHVLSAVRAPVIVQSSFVLATAIAILAGVDFLGLGDPSQPSWGRILQEAFNNIYTNPSNVLWPALLISASILALVLLGNGLRDTLQASNRSAALKPARRKALLRSAHDERVAGANDLTPRRDDILTIRDLRVGYPRTAQEVTEVVHGVDFDLSRGEIHGLVGESGSGKSQIAFSILGILPREAVVLGGSVFFEGKDLLADKARLRKVRGRSIAYIPQEPMSNLDPSFTVGAQLVYGLRAATGASKKDARDQLSALLKRVGITDAERVMKLYPHEISGGMAQRVLICGAVASNPQLIIADEPTTALDVTVQAEVLELLRELSTERGLAMIIVTHNLGVVADICDTVSVMRAGRIVETGTVDELFAAPQNPYTQDLLASSRQVELLEVSDD
ncbi:dipeptide/oligopeptide/nickel ABC transporter permease/ATP-binding protein [Rathayibacter festucae]|uniref:ATP-binding cassette domain-containing protein n=1 Tax=Rathayibacter festucae TaxID=110937 RepID=A0ABX6GZG8_9MICO|nr:dipeptide/oligopeptide/nickel ABC transporter permease/ATP-binding protein [Rathayibacter festucae]MCJ1701814.1 dipeptide/oligopeptide/nickel ABC transporter permease/ATP-binding protein [Rathayibacter festucae]QHC62823.1 ATP-binding cassette domain-containing protein [Rathayibacter festucae]